MSRFAVLLPRTLFARASVLVILGAVAISTITSDPARGQRDKARTPVAERDTGIDLSHVPVTRKSERPAEKVSAEDLDSIEETIRARSSSEAAAPDDGVSPGAPTDEEVRAELRQLRREMGAGATGPIKRGGSGLVRPTNGTFTSPFGQRWGRLHAGIDLAAPTGTPVYAAAAGRVILMAPTGGYGNYTCIDHGSSVSTCYAHQSQFATSEGAPVRQGEVIGYVGNTGHSFGAHLHFEVRVDGQPVDPMGYL